MSSYGNISYKKIYFKDNKRFILFKYYFSREYHINETDAENILDFKSLKEARDYLRNKGVLKCRV